MISQPRAKTRPVGAYSIGGEIGSGGMATVHFGRLVGPGGFVRIVAIKRLHPPFAKDSEFVSMFLDEARLAASVRHPNVLSIVDVVSADDELLLVMDYIEGETLSKVGRSARERGERIPLGIVAAIMTGVLHGLHAAHEATDPQGAPLGIVHRDVSPQNVLVGADGVARVLDFGVAKAAGRLHTTREGQVKGKLAYMAPEQLTDGTIDRRTDVYSAGVVLWETLTGQRLFDGSNEGAVLERVLLGKVAPPSKHAPDLPPQLDAITLRALERDPQKRFATARDLAIALERALPPSLPSDVGRWVLTTAGDALRARAEAMQLELDRETMAPRASDARSGVTGARGGTSMASSSLSSASSRRISRWGMPIAAVLGAAIATTAWLVITRSSRGTPALTVIAPTDATSAAPVAQPDAVSRTAPPPSDAAPTATVSAEPTAARRGRTTSARSPRGQTSTDPCSPPFTIDASGDKIYKRNCL